MILNYLQYDLHDLPVFYYHENRNYIVYILPSASSSFFLAILFIDTGVYRTYFYIDTI